MTRGLIASSSAASFCTQLDIFSASISAARSMSSSAMPDGGIFTGEWPLPPPCVEAISPRRRSSAVICVPSVSSIARSMAFSSSRMLPGQLYRISSLLASESRPSIFFFSSPEKRLMKKPASACTSSLRSRSGGISMVTTFSR